MKKPSKADSHARKARGGRILANPLGATLIVGGLLLAMALTIQVALAGKPKPPPPPPPPVYYNIVQLGLGAAFDMNDDGILVGHQGADDQRRAFQFDEVYFGTDLNEILGASLVDLDYPNPSPVPLSETDWIAVSAKGINNLGEIVGKARNSVGDARVFHLSGNVFQLLPGLVADLIERTVDINDLGTICVADGNNSVAVYIPNEFGIYAEDLYTYTIELPISPRMARINNFGVIVATDNLFADEATSIMIEPGVTGYADVSTTTFLHCALRHMSDYWMCGVRAKVGKTNGGPIRVSIENHSVEPLTKTNYPWSAAASGVNNDGDVVNSAMQALYKDGVSLSLDDLIAPEDRDIWNEYVRHSPQGVSNRIVVGNSFPLILDTADRGDRNFEVLLLIPRTP